MNLSIRSGTVGYNNKILVSDGTFGLRKNSKVNTFELAKGGDKPKIIHKAVVQPTITHKTLSHEEKKLLWYWRLYPVVYVSINRSLRPGNKISSTVAAI